MNVGEVTRIVGLCCLPFRKGEEFAERVDGGVKVMTIDLNPPLPTDIDQLAGRVMVDVHFFICAVHTERAAHYSSDLRRLLAKDMVLLQSGPSYIRLGEELDSQEQALMLMALGEVMKFWKVITPSTLGLHGDEADRAAGVGYVMITQGFKEPPHV